MKKIVLSFLLALLFILSLNSLIKVNGEDLYLHEIENYNDFGNTINQAQEFEYNLIGDNSFKYAVPVNTMYSFGFKYKKSTGELREWFGFMTDDFRWLYNYSICIHNPEGSNAYVTIGWGSDFMNTWPKLELPEHFTIGEAYSMNFGVLEAYSDSNKTKKVAERFIVEVYKGSGESKTLLGKTEYDNYNFDDTIVNATRGDSFYFHLNEGFYMMRGNYYKEISEHNEPTYGHELKTKDLYEVLGVDANYRHSSGTDYYISGSGTINNLMSFGLIYTSPTQSRNFVSFNIPYGTSWNTNYSFTFRQNGVVTLGYGSDYQNFGLFVFEPFELGRKYVFEYGSQERYLDEELTNKCAERIIINVYKNEDDGTFSSLGTAFYDLWDNEYYEYFPLERRGNNTFIYHYSGTTITCGFYERDYKAVMVNSDGYDIIDLSYGKKYDLSQYKENKEHYTFSYFYTVNSEGKRIRIEESGIWYTDLSEYIDNVYTGNIYKEYSPDEYTITYNIPNVRSNKNQKIYVADEDVELIEPELKDGYMFNGFHYKSDLSDEVIDTIINKYENLTIYADVRESYKIDYKLNDKIIYSETVGKDIPTTLKTKFGDIVVDELLLDGNKISGEYTFTKDSVVEVKGSLPTYNITYHLNDGINSTNNQNTYTLSADCPIENAHKDNELFGGWYLDSKYQNEVHNFKDLEGDVDLYARFYNLDSYKDIEIVLSDEEYHFPQLHLPKDSLVKVRLYDSNKSSEIELSNRISYTFNEVNEYILSYEIETIYGETYSKDITLKVIEKNNKPKDDDNTEPSTETPADDNPSTTNTDNSSSKKKGCKGNIMPIYLITLFILIVLVVFYRKRKCLYN